jgi:hypothetical protein
MFTLNYLPVKHVHVSLKAYSLSEFSFFLILKVANIRCFILIAGEIFHNIYIIVTYE